MAVTIQTVIFVILIIYVIPVGISMLLFNKTHDILKSAMTQIPVFGPYYSAYNYYTFTHALPGILFTGAYLTYLLQREVTGGERSIIIFCSLLMYCMVVMLFPSLAATWFGDENELGNESREIDSLEEEVVEEEDDCEKRLVLQEAELRRELSACPPGQRCTGGG